MNTTTKKLEGFYTVELEDGTEAEVRIKKGNYSYVEIDGQEILFKGFFIIGGLDTGFTENRNGIHTKIRYNIVSEVCNCPGCQITLPPLTNKVKFKVK